MDEGDGRCALFSLATLPRRLGGPGARLGNGGQEPALGPSGPTSLLRGSGTPITGRLCGREILGDVQLDQELGVDVELIERVFVPHELGYTRVVRRVHKGIHHPYIYDAS